MEKTNRLGARRWISFILIGFVGQIAWAIENQFINSWVFSQSGDVRHITWMTVASAVVATLTTFFIGALSDRLGKRKLFVSIGYIAWGLAVFLFGIMSLGNMSKLSGGNMATAILLVGIANVVVDCVMTFFGSTANDACFNAIVTDQTNEHNRPLMESVLSVLPLFGMAAMLGVGACFGIPSNVQSGESLEEFATRMAHPWLLFFLVFGLLTSIVGVVALFLLPKDQIAPNRDGGYMKNLVYGFRPKAIKESPKFYIALLSFLFFNIAVDAFMPFYIVYFNHNIRVGEGAYALLGGQADFYLAMGIILGVSSLAVILLGAFMDRIGKLKLLLPSILIMAIGAILFFVSNNLAMTIVSGVITMTGYLLGTAVLGAELRDQTPKDNVGAYQGVRMVFAVMLPMIIGSGISTLCFRTNYTNDFGQTERLPDKWMFIVTLVAAILALAPAIWLIIKDHKDRDTVKE